MIQWIRNITVYKSFYSLLCFVISILICFFAGYDYRLSKLDHTSSIDSYGELLIVIVFVLSGIIVLIHRKTRLNSIVCFVLILVQVWCFFFCEKHEATARLEIFKWFSLTIAPFTMLLLESPKNNHDTQKTQKTNRHTDVISTLFTPIGIALILISIAPFFQSGVLFAEAAIDKRMGFIQLFIYVGFIFIINGIIILFFKSETMSKIFYYSIIMSLMLSGILILFLGISDVPALMFYMLAMFVFSLFIFVLVLIKYKRAFK